MLGVYLLNRTEQVQLVLGVSQYARRYPHLCLLLPWGTLVLRLFALKDLSKQKLVIDSLCGLENSMLTGEHHLK
jgi:hypothetical protein